MTEGWAARGTEERLVSTGRGQRGVPGEGRGELRQGEEVKDCRLHQDVRRFRQESTVGKRAKPEAESWAENAYSDSRMTSE